MVVVKFIILVTIAYFLGNISPAIILGKMQGKDIKKEGSGNAGTTNALRVLGKKAAIITLVIDIAKGALAVFLGMYFGNYTIGMVCALAVFCGHIWPCIYHFKGGKGVATAFGAILAVNWILALLELLVVAVGLAISGRMSVGSLLGAIAFPFLCWIFEPSFIWIGLIMAIIVIIKHRANIKRLFKGEEPRMFKKDGK
jgi:glycerol-3-phosphate acyltransferase PlsY